MTDTTETTNAKQTTIDELPTRQWFSSNNLNAGSEAIAVVMAAAEVSKIPVLPFNFDVDADFPAGYGLSIIINTERSADKTGNIPVEVVIAAVPEPETVAADPAGAEWSRNAIISALLTKLSSAARGMRRAGGSISNLPFSVSEFISSQRGSGESLAVFNALAGIYVKGFKAKGFSHMSKNLLRSLLQSAEFAEQQFPGTPQARWEGLLNAMITKAEAGIMVDKQLVKYNPAILRHWLETRNNVAAPAADDELFAELEGIV